MPEDLYYWIALRLTFGIGNVNYKNLISHFGTPEKIFSAGREELLQVEGISSRAVDSIVEFKPAPEIEKELEAIESKGIDIVTITSDIYPENLKNIYDPPPFLYVKGELAARNKSAVAVIGSRNASSYGLKAAERLSRELASLGITVVSGMARGIDSCAHKSALAGGGRTIAVLGSGIDMIYPAENAKLYKSISERGAVVSEYMIGTEPHSYNFPARNRIISGMSLGVLVVEASPKSGSLITARCALEQGREVFAVPGNVYSFNSKGSHLLLKSGAKLVEKASDILEELRLETSGSAKSASGALLEPLEELSKEGRKVYDILGDEPVHIDDIITKLGMSIGVLSSVLLDLELKGHIKQIPGNRYLKT